MHCETSCVSDHPALAVLTFLDGSGTPPREEGNGGRSPVLVPKKNLKNFIYFFEFSSLYIGIEPLNIFGPPKHILNLQNKFWSRKTFLGDGATFFEELEINLKSQNILCDGKTFKEMGKLLKKWRNFFRSAETFF